MNICEQCRRKLTVIGVGATICVYCAGLVLNYEPMPDTITTTQLQEAIAPVSHDDEKPAAAPTEAQRPTAVAAVSGASSVPFGWNMTAKELPPAARRRSAAIMEPAENSGWLVQRTES